MSFELREGQGTLHRVQDKEGNERRPDYTGQVNIDGKMWRISGWIKLGRSGKWLSLSVELPRAEQAALTTPAKQARPIDDDESPPF